MSRIGVSGPHDEVGGPQRALKLSMVSGCSNSTATAPGLPLPSRLQVRTRYPQQTRFPEGMQELMAVARKGAAMFLAANKIKTLREHAPVVALEPLDMD